MQKNNFLLLKKFKNTESAQLCPNVDFEAICRSAILKRAIFTIIDKNPCWEQACRLQATYSFRRGFQVDDEVDPKVEVPVVDKKVEPPGEDLVLWSWHLAGLVQVLHKAVPENPDSNIYLVFLSAPSFQQDDL